MKAKKKSIKHKIREEKGRERRIVSTITVTILITVISISGFAISSILNQPPTSQTVSTSEPKACIVDQGGVAPTAGYNKTFIQTTTNILKQAGYTVDYYPGEEVTVEFYRNLPTHEYELIILRVHSTAAAYQEEEFVEAPVCFFTCEPYSKTKYIYGQLTDQIACVSYNTPQPPYYFAITPKFITSSMNSKFNNTVIIMMGCEGLHNAKMAEAFIQKGAKVYISWNEMVSASHTDQATTKLLKHLITEKQTIKQAVIETMEEVGPDPIDYSILLYYPLESGNYVFPVSPNNEPE